MSMRSRCRWPSTQGGPDAIAAQAITIAALTNTVVKTAIASVLGSPAWNRC